MRALVTGASGFVGANLVRHLLRAGHEVHALLRPEHLGWRLEEIRHDLRVHLVALEDREGVAAAAATIRPQWVFHLAAYGAYPAQADVQRMLAVNVQGTANLVDACLATDFEAFVHTGSSSEYGFKQRPAAEGDLLEPNSYYAVSKAAATHYCTYTARHADRRIRTVRLYSVYGPYEEPSRLMPTLIEQGLRQRWPPLVSPRVARDFVYVDDVCRACILAATEPDDEPGAIYNVGTGVQTSLAQVVELAREVLEIRAEPVWGTLQPRSWDHDVWCADITKIQTRLGWRPVYDLEAGFRALVGWHAGRLGGGEAGIIAGHG